VSIYQLSSRSSLTKAPLDNPLGQVGVVEVLLLLVLVEVVEAVPFYQQQSDGYILEQILRV
jgi:hypothetical protein